MKFLLKVALLVAAAKFVVHTPEGTSRHLDSIARTTVRDLAKHVDEAFTVVEARIKKLLS